MPMKPTNFLATKSGTTTIDFTLGAADDDVTIIRNAETKVEVGRIAKGLTLLQKGGFVPNTRYNFAATAVDGRGVESEPVYDGTITDALPPAPPPPEPAPIPPDVVITDPIIPPGCIPVTMDEFNKVQAGGKNYLLKPGQYQFSDGDGLTFNVNGAKLYSEPGKTIVRHTGTLEYPKCVRVYGDDCGAYGLTVATNPKACKCQGFNVSSGASRFEIANCTAPDGEIGVFIESDGCSGLNVHDCTLQKFVRYFMYGKYADLTVKNVKTGISTGGTYNGKNVPDEHGARLEWYAGSCLIENFTCPITIKSAFNAKRRKNSTDKLRIVRCNLGNIGLGPLGDGDGLDHKSDPAYIATGIAMDNVRMNNLTMEMNLIALQAYMCIIKKVNIVDDYRYKPWRKIASGTFLKCNVTAWSGPKDNITITN